PYRDLADLASRSGMASDGLERLASAGACESLGVPQAERLAGRNRAPRRDELWRLGMARGSARSRRRPDAHLALPLPLPAPPDLRPLDSWERIVADYASTGVTLDEHPMQVIRPHADRRLTTTGELAETRDGARIAVGGLVVARQKPATARGVV